MMSTSETSYLVPYAKTKLHNRVPRKSIILSSKSERGVCPDIAGRSYRHK